MKPFPVFGVIIFCLTQCIPAKTNTWGIDMKEVYLQEFRLTYFDKLLRAGFNKSNAIDSVLQLDHSHFTEPVLSDEDSRFIDSLVTMDNRRMVSDSAESIGRMAEGAEGKHVLDYVLERLESKELRKLILSRYRNWQRQELGYLKAAGK